MTVPHIPIATIDGMADRRLRSRLVEDVFSDRMACRWTISPPCLPPIRSARLSHRRRTRPCRKPPIAMGMPDEYYAKLAASYQQRREYSRILERHHFTCYSRSRVLHHDRISAFDFADDVEFGNTW